MVNESGKRDGEQCQPHHAQPRIAEARVIERHRQTDSAEEQQRKDPLPDGQIRPVSDERSDRAAGVLNRRIRIDRMARPIGRMKTAEGEQQKKPDAGSGEQGKRFENMRTLQHESFSRGIWPRGLHINVRYVQTRPFHERSNRVRQLQPVSPPEPEG